MKNFLIFLTLIIEISCLCHTKKPKCPIGQCCDWKLEELEHPEKCNSEPKTYIELRGPSEPPGAFSCKDDQQFKKRPHYSKEETDLRTFEGFIDEDRKKRDQTEVMMADQEIPEVPPEAEETEDGNEPEIPETPEIPEEEPEKPEVPSEPQQPHESNHFHPDIPDVKIYPHPGSFYLFTPTNKYLFRMGNTLFIERRDTFYSKWITSTGGENWDLNDNFLWTWDDKGKWFPAKETSDEREIPHIPFVCINRNCPRIVKFPSIGLWLHYHDGTIMYIEGHHKYIQTKNGFFNNFVKYKGEEKQCCPDYWTWYTKTGEWYGIEEGPKKTCNHHLPHSQRKMSRTKKIERLITIPKGAFNM